MAVLYEQRSLAPPEVGRPESTFTIRSVERDAGRDVDNGLSMV